MPDLTSLWPAAGISARSGDLELRWIDDDLLASLANLASRGIHDPADMPFAFPWTRGTPDEVARSVLTYQWSARTRLSPQHLALELAVLAAGEPVGIQAVSAPDWGVLRTGETGSWLGRQFQGRGIGARMRVLMLHVLFDGLGAREITSTAFVDNAASNGVSRAVGYLPDGEAWVAREGRPSRQRRYRMPRERWVEVRESHAARLGAPVVLDGVAHLREFVTPSEG